MRYVKSLFTNIQKQEIYKLHGYITREFSGLRMRNFKGIIFI